MRAYNIKIATKFCMVIKVDARKFFYMVDHDPCPGQNF